MSDRQFPTPYHFRSRPSLLFDGLLILFEIFILDYFFFSPGISALAQLLLLILGCFLVGSFYYFERATILLLIFAVPLSELVSHFFGEPIAPFSLYLSSACVIGFLLKRVLHSVTRELNREIEGTIHWLDRVVEGGKDFWTLITLLSFLMLMLGYSNLYPLSGDPFHDYVISKDGRSLMQAFTSCLFVAANMINALLLLVFWTQRVPPAHYFRALNVLLFSYLPVTLVGLLQQRGIIGITTPEGAWQSSYQVGRLNASFTDPNALATSLLFLFPAAFFFLIFRRQALSRIFYVSVIAGGGYLLYLSASKTAFWGVLLELILIGLLLLIYAVRMGNYRLAVGGLAAFLLTGTVAIGAFYFLKSSLLFSRVAPTFEYLEENLGSGTLFTNLERIATYRARWWPLTIEMLQERPLTGIGVGSFPFESINAGIPFFDSAGNFYLQMAAEFGIPGLAFVFLAVLLFAVINGYLLRSAWRCPHQEQTGLILSSVVATTVFGVMLVVGSHVLFHQVNLIFVTFLGATGVLFKARVPVSFLDRYLGTQRARWTARAVALAALILFVTAGFSRLERVEPEHFRAETLGQEQDLFGYGEEGRGEFRFRWLKQKNVTRLELPSETLRLEVFTTYPEVHDKPITAEFFVNSHRVGSITLADHETHSVSLEIPEPFLEKTVTFEVITNRIWRPQDYGSADWRELSIAVRGLPAR